ncbi:MAG TPA: hypothetical protein VJH24_04860 [Candidatus Bilamarchaeaceae archaeon]|nr:hypothetical protein [Candidatus Bilamarchaeaceae archaeon]
MKEFCTVEPCASAKAYEIKFGRKIDIEKLQQALGEAVVSSTPVVLLCRINGKPVSIYASGRAMIKDISKEKAEEIGRKLVEFL